MARIPTFYTEEDINDLTARPGGQQNGGSRGGSYSSSSNSRDQLNNNTIAEQVINSPAYKSAHQVLSQEPNKAWLQRLQMIPYSVSDASSTILDDWGFSNNYNDKQDANFQYCMEQISALMQEYYSWKNSLPTTQVQQFSDAGINSAITGQGVNGSSISNVGVSSDPSRLSSANTGEVITSMVGNFLSLSSGVLDWIGKFNEISLAKRTQTWNEDKSFAEFKNILSEKGVILPDEVKGFSDIVGPKAQYANFADNAPARAKKILSEYQEIRNMDAYGTTVVKRSLDGSYGSDTYKYGDSLYGYYGSSAGAHIDVSQYSSDIADLQYNLFINELKYKSNYAKAKVKFHDEYGYTNTESAEYQDALSKALQTETESYERDKTKIYVDYIKKLKEESDNGNMSSRLQLMDALYELSNLSMASDFGDQLLSAISEWWKEFELF